MNELHIETAAITTGVPEPSSKGLIAPRQSTLRASIIADAPAPLKHYPGVLVTGAMMGCKRLLVRSREATEQRTNRKGVVLTFADTGTNITPETRKYLHTAFFTKDIGGTGLGLWVSSASINGHSGRLRVRSCVTPGKNWTFSKLFLSYLGRGRLG